MEPSGPDARVLHSLSGRAQFEKDSAPSLLRGFYLLLAFSFLACTAAISQNVAAQDGPPPVPKAGMFPAPSRLPVVPQEQVISYWTTETGWMSELQLRNNSLQDLTVTPVLRLTDGSEDTLPAVTIKPEEAVSVDLEKAIARAEASGFLGTYGSAVLRYLSPTQASLYAAMMVRRPGRPIAFHIDATGNAESLQTGGSEGIWWLPKSTTNGYLITSNLGGSTIPFVLSVYDPSGKENRQNLSLAAHQTLRFSIRDLVRAAGFESAYGGIRISATTHAGSLATLHFLFDENVGFSALLKMFDYDPKATLAERDYAGTGSWTMRAPMLALSSPDAALAFPRGTQLRPLLFIRNTTEKTIAATLRFNWRSETTTGSAAGPALQLAPYQTREVDVTALQKSGEIPEDANWALVTLVTNSLPDEVVFLPADVVARRIGGHPVTERID